MTNSPVGFRRVSTQEVDLTSLSLFLKQTDTEIQQYLISQDYSTAENEIYKTHMEGEKHLLHVGL